MIDYFIGLGTNLGDRGAALRNAVKALQQHGDIASFSPVFETVAVGPSQDLFLNATLKLRSALTAPAMLRTLQAIERENGRVRTERWGARTLDLDLLLGGGLTIVSAALVLPHPRLHERGFVLAPLVCIAADELIPSLGVSVRQAYAAWRARDGAGIELYAGTDVPPPINSTLAELGRVSRAKNS